MSTRGSPSIYYGADSLTSKRNVNGAQQPEDH